MGRSASGWGLRFVTPWASAGEMHRKAQFINPGIFRRYGLPTHPAIIRTFRQRHIKTVGVAGIGCQYRVADLVHSSCRGMPIVLATRHSSCTALPLSSILHSSRSQGCPQMAQSMLSGVKAGLAIELLREGERGLPATPPVSRYGTAHSCGISIAYFSSAERRAQTIVAVIFGLSHVAFGTPLRSHRNHQGFHIPFTFNWDPPV